MTFPSWARINEITSWAVLVFGFFVPGMAQEPPANANSFVIRNAKVFDGKKVSSQATYGFRTAKSRRWAETSRFLRI